MHYSLYKKGLITEKEYLARICPLDTKIEYLEWSNLQDSLVLKVSFS